MPNLSFAQNRQNYVGIPLDAADNTLGVLQEKYIQNKDAADKLEIMLNNLELLPGDQQYKDQVGQEVSGILDDVTKNGDWENATLHIKNAAKQVAGNPGLNQALKSKQQRELGVKALQEKVGKPFEEGGITQLDFQREVKKADDNYGGVINDNGIWKGHWNAKTPPAYLDRGAYIDEFLDGWEADKVMGNLAKGKDGKWYQVKYTTTPDGSHHITEYTEEAKYSEVYGAAKKQLMQNANIKERVQYEVANTPGDYADFVAQGINRASMTKELKQLGHSESKLNAMSDEDLTHTFKTEMVVHESIKGAVDKHSYERESAQVLGKTWDQLQREMRLKNASRSGGDDQTVVLDRVISQFLTKGYSVTNIPKSIDDYQKNIDTWDKEIVKHRKAVDDIRAQIATNPDDKTLQAELMSAQTKLQEYERTSKEYDYWYEKSVKKVLEGQSDLSKGEVNKYFRDKQRLKEVRNNPQVQNVIKALGKGKTPAFSRSGMLTGTLSLGPTQRTAELRKLRQEGKVTQAEVDAYSEYAELENSASSFFGKMNNTQAEIIDQINAEMEKAANEKTVAYGYVDLSVDDFGKETAFSKRATTLLHNNYNNYRVIDTDGEAVEFNNLDQDDKYIPENTRVLGVTTQYIGDHGYLMYAAEDIYDKDNNKTGQRFHLIKPETMSGILDSAIMEARKGSKIQNNQIKEGYNLSSPNELEQIWRATDVDRQLSAFDNHPIIAPIDQGSDKAYDEITKPVNIGVRYDAKVTRMVNNAGDVKWKVDVKDKVTGETATSDPYGSQYSAEFALEYLAGSGYAVPLSTLKRMTDYDLVNGTIDRNQVSTPYMNPDFYNEMKKFDDMVSTNYTITSMTRSLEDNKKANGIETSRHKHGFGVDLRVNDALVDFLAQNSTDIPNSEYKKLMGANLMYLIHDAGSGQHVHLEHTKVPDGVKRTSDISYLFK